MGARHSNTVVFIGMEVVSDLQNVFRVQLGDWEAHILVLSPEPGPLFWELSVYIYLFLFCISLYKFSSLLMIYGRVCPLR